MIQRLLASLVVLSCASFAQTTIHVPADQPTIQAGIDAAGNGDTVLVAAGTYHERIDFKGKNLKLWSEAGPDTTIIDGDYVGGVVTIKSGETRDAEVRGFTIRRGTAPFSQSYGGGGFYIVNSSPTITGNIIRENQKGCEGLAIYVSFGSPLIQDNKITQNGGNDVCGPVRGIAVYVNGTKDPDTVTIVHNQITANISTEPVVYVFGGASAIIQNNFIANNDGGGIALTGNVTGSSDVIQNVVVNNPGIALQAGTAASPVPTRVIGNVVVQKDSPVYYQQAPVQLASAVLLSNNIVVAAAGQGGVNCQTYNNLTPTVTGTDVQNSAGPLFAGTCFNSLIGTNGNLSVDPKFVDPANNNVHFLPESPLIDAGVSGYALTMDFDGATRVVDGKGTGTAVIDMGTYEYQGTTSVSFSPSSITFGPQKIKSVGTPVPVTVTNTGTTTLFARLSVTGPFLATTDCNRPAGVAAGATCTIQVSFAPITGADQPGSISLAGNVTASSSISLDGFATAPVVSLSPNPLDFGDQALFATSSPRLITLTNTGDASLVVSQVSAGLIFGVTTDCVTVAPGATCSINVTFTPQQRGIVTGQVVIQDDTVTGFDTAALSGNGVGPGISVTPANAAFPDTLIGQTSAIVPFTISSIGESNLDIASITTTGNFGISSKDCPASLPPGQTCTVSIVFVPNAIGTQFGVLRIVHDGPASPFQGTLSGRGLSPRVTLTGISPFTPQLIGTSVNKQLTITNTGNYPLLTTAISANSDFAVANDTCSGASVPVNQSCTFDVVFTPTAGGQRTGTLQISSNFLGGAVVSQLLSGTAITTYLAPTVTTATPGALKSGPSAPTITVTGTNFYPTSVVRWNGSARPTALVSATQLTAQLTDADVAAMGLARVTVFNPTPGGGESGPVEVPVYASLAVSAADMVSDRSRGVIYAAIAAASSLDPNSVVTIDPVTQSITQVRSFPGRDPYRVVLSADGRFLYVAMRGTSDIARIDLTGALPVLNIALGSDSFFGAYYAIDMQPSPINSRLLAVALGVNGITVPGQKVVAFLDGTQLPGAGGSYIDEIRFAADGTTLIGSQLAVSPASLVRMKVDAATGTRFVDSQWNFNLGIFETDGKLLFTNSGSVYDVTTLASKGRFSFPDFFYGQLALDARNQRVYFIGPASGTNSIIIQDSVSFLKVKTIALPGLTSDSGGVVLFGSDGVAFRKYNRYDSLHTQDQIFFVRTGLRPKAGKKADVDGDGKADRLVWRPSTGTWFSINSTDGKTTATQWGAVLGGVADIPVAGDYDGDGKTDLAVWRPSNGTWYVIRSSDGQSVSQQWGTSGDIPVPADYDGDGKTDFAVWRPSTGTWFVIRSSDTQSVSQQWGAVVNGVQDIPVPQDYDGDGKADFAVWRPGTGTWFVIRSSDNQNFSQQWGATLGGVQDVPVRGDFDGDGRADFAVWRPASGTWFVIRSSDNQNFSQQWGATLSGTADVPVPDDYDGDGKTDFAVWRPSDGYWYVIPSGGSNSIATQWGASSDVPSQRAIH